MTSNSDLEGTVVELGSLRPARSATPPGTGWNHVWGLVPIAAALALWAFALAGVLAPLGGALAQLDAARRETSAPATCPTPPGALASAAAGIDAGAGRCR